MPIHDWTRVRANRFHDFHQGWTVEIRNALNAGVLPAGYFAMAEQITGGPEADVVAQAESNLYARIANRITIRHPDRAVVSVIEIVSPGNKDRCHALHAFAQKSIEFLQAGINLLIVDLFPPSRCDPQGIHEVIWGHICDQTFELPPDKPLTLAAYAAASDIVAYVEPVAVGDILPDLPIFLTPDHYVPCPLEATYQAAWNVFPAVLRAPLEHKADDASGESGST